MAASKGWLEKLRRFVCTIYFILAMLVSLVVASAYLLVALVDILVPCLLISSFTCISCYTIKEHLNRYDFRNSFTDVPLVSLIRSLIITCVYSICDDPALYFGTVMLCSFISILFLSVKACLFSHLKKSWGMPILFLSSVVFALGHTVVAYRIRCKARRKFLFHRVDTTDILPCNSSFQRVPKVVHTEKEFSIRSLASVDSLFTSCQGLTIHYKLSLPSSVITFLDKSAVNTLHRSSSQKFHMSSLYAPLLEEHSTLMPSDEVSTSKFPDLEANDEIGIVLVHGFGGGVFSWRHVMTPLALQLGHTVAAFDRPGWGLSSRPRRKDWEESHMENPYKLESQVDLLLAFCSKVGFTSVVLVGHDDGGLLALKAAQKIIESPNKIEVNIKGVVLLNVSLSREIVPGFARILLHTSLEKKHMIRPLLRTEITQVVNRHAWYDSGKLTRDILRLYKAPLCVKGWDEALHEIGILSSEMVLTPQKMSLLLESIKELPVLVIAGAEDVMVPLKTVQSMSFKLANSKLVAISGCGHLPHEECPKALMAAITPFISRVLLDSSSSSIQTQ